jgi:3-hydroxyacyl-[acyl-carrier-protein] dehydratase
VAPGDQLELVASVKRQLRGVWKFTAEARVGGELCVSAEIMSTYRELKQ